MGCYLAAGLAGYPIGADWFLRDPAYVAWRLLQGLNLREPRGPSRDERAGRGVPRRRRDGGARLLGGGLSKVGDKTLIDGLNVTGSAKVVAWFSRVIRVFQSGYIYHYAFVMILGMLGLLSYFVIFPLFAK